MMQRQQIQRFKPSPTFGNGPQTVRKYPQIELEIVGQKNPIGEDLIQDAEIIEEDSRALSVLRDAGKLGKVFGLELITAAGFVLLLFLKVVLWLLVIVLNNLSGFVLPDEDRYQLTNRPPRPARRPVIRVENNVKASPGADVSIINNIN